MKKLKRALFLLLAISVIVSSAAFSVFASNTTDYGIYDFEVPFQSYSIPLYPREKEDATPIYLYITSAKYSYSGIATQALAYTSRTSSYNSTLTVSNGVCVQYVTCIPYVQHSIHSDIYEEGYSYASLRFFTGGISSGEVISGVWSPDSTRTYTSAT